MDEILYELREHAAGLNAGRWDYIFSIIKRFRERPDIVLPDRGQVTMAVPFMRAYTRLLVATCHRRGAHAIGGMSAFIPNRREPDVTENALAKVREDKERESGDGFDGTWVAHPDLVPVATEVFDRVLGDRPNQKAAPGLGDIEAAALLDVAVPGGRVTEAGVRQNVSVAIRYLDSWLRGTGAAAIDDLMEDAATAEISRSQLWQWRRHATPLEDGTPFTAERYAAHPRRGAGARRARQRPSRGGRRAPRRPRAGRRLRRVPDARGVPPARLTGGVSRAARARARRSARTLGARRRRRRARRTSRGRSSSGPRRAPRGPRTACSRSSGGARRRGSSAGRPGRTGRGRRRRPTSMAPLLVNPNSRAGVVESRSTIRSRLIRPAATPAS